MSISDPEASTEPGGHLSVDMLSGPARAGLMTALCIGVLGAAFEMFSITTIMPNVANEFSAMNHFAWGFTMFIIGQVFSFIVSGRLIDRFGAFKPLAVGVGLFAFGLILAAASTHLATFLAARTVQGLGGGAMNIAVMVVIAEVFPPHRRSIMMTIFSFCYLAPAFFGGPLAAFIANAPGLGWRWDFWMIIPFLVIAAIVGYQPVRTLYRHRAARSGTPDEAPVWAAIAGTGGMGLLQAASQSFVQLKSLSDLNWTTIVFAVAGIVALGFAMHRLMPPGFWRFSTGMASLMWVRLALAGAFFACQSFVVLMLMQARGLSQQMASWAMAVGAIGWVAATILQARPELKLRRDQIITVGSSFVSFAILFIAAMAAWPRIPLGFGVVIMIVAGFGMGLSSASTSLAVMTMSPSDAIGHNTSALQVADGLGSAFFAGLSGIIMPVLTARVSVHATFGWMYAVNGVVALASMVLSLRLGRVRNESSGVG